MGLVCEHLATADLCVDDVSAAITELVEVMGFPKPGRAGRQNFVHQGWDVLFSRVNRDAVRAPTLFELLAPLDGPDEPHSRIGRITVQRQRGRAIRSHATVVMTSCLDELVSQVRNRGVPHWLQPIEDELAPFARLWIGVRPNDLACYDPTVDFGLMLEFVPADAKGKARERPAESSPEATRFDRIIGREFIVKSIDATASFLRETFNWLSQHEVRDEPKRGYRFVTMECADPNGGALKLVEPLSGTGQHGNSFLGEVTTGAGRIVIASSDLEGIALEFDAKGINYALHAAGRYEPRTLIPQLPILGDALAIVPIPHF